MEERNYTPEKLVTRARGEIDGLYFLFESQEVRNQLMEWISNKIQSSSADQVASVLGDAVNFHINERKELDDKLQDLESQVEEMKLSLMDSENTLEIMEERNKELEKKLDIQVSLNEMYRDKGVTGDSVVVTQLLQTVNTLTNQLVEAQKHNAQTVKELTVTAMESMREVSTHEVNYPQLPDTQVHVVQQPTQQPIQYAQQPIPQQANPFNQTVQQEATQSSATSEPPKTVVFAPPEQKIKFGEDEILEDVFVDEALFENENIVEDSTPDTLPDFASILAINQDMS